MVLVIDHGVWEYGCAMKPVGLLQFDLLPQETRTSIKVPLEYDVQVASNRKGSFIKALGALHHAAA